MVKGKRRPVTAYVVGAAYRSRDHHVDRLPLTGVGDELEALGSDLDDVIGGAGRVVEIVGDQGTGKSRLVEELARRTGSVRSMTIICESYETTTPYASIWYLGRAVLGLEMGADKDTVARHLRQRVETDVPDLLPLLPAHRHGPRSRAAGHPGDGGAEARVPAAGRGQGHRPIPGRHPRSPLRPDGGGRPPHGRGVPGRSCRTWRPS